MIEWHPISEHDGTTLPVLLGSATDGWTGEGYWEPERGGWWRANTHWTDATDGQLYPTHFTPMPEPPK